MERKGYIALDIDGTITDATHSIPMEVASYLKDVESKGWQLMFITGRTFSFAYSALKVLDFPYYFAMQNGADILQMPQRQLLSRSYLNSKIIPYLEEAYEGKNEDFLVYAGYEKGDFCFYRPSRFSPDLYRYLDRIKAVSPEPWKAVENFNQLKEFSLIKCLGSKEVMKEINLILSANPSIHATMIRDPMREGLYLNLVTDTRATKGHAVDRIVEKLGVKGPIIAAGDDLNDMDMLHRADIRIVMETAPSEMLTQADIIASGSAKMGIIEALENAFKRVSENGD